MFLVTEMTRRLSRKAKDLACMRQLGLCAYCSCALSDAMQTDHMDEDRTNDAWDNLACACGTCHADKTQHYRKGRLDELNAMLSRATENKHRWAVQWAEGSLHDRLPEWLQYRIDTYEAQLYHIRQRNEVYPPSHTLDLEIYRYKQSSG